MTRKTYKIDIISPCFCSGADASKQAEVRAPSIRGQLRWWFRVLGGFKSLAALPLAEQEASIFGSTAGDDGVGSKLIIRVKPPAGQTLAGSIRYPEPSMGSSEGYLLFPLRNQARMKSSLTEFSLEYVWLGPRALGEDIEALISVFVHLGSLGFRGRRAMGALAFHLGDSTGVSLRDALKRFNTPQGINVRTLGTDQSERMTSVLAGWLKEWRSHGRTGSNPREMKYPGFYYAKKDHDTGAAVLGRTDPPVPGATYRPALGLPIVQFFSRSRGKVNWEFGDKKSPGRFASPILLRPHRDASGAFHALVIFVESRKWPENHPVHLNGLKRPVSLELYEKMKADEVLSDFV